MAEGLGCIERMAEHMEAAVGKLLADYDASKWQPIETADHTHRVEILAELASGKVVIAEFEDDRSAAKPRPFWNWYPWRISVARADQPVRWQSVPPAIKRCEFCEQPILDDDVAEVGDLIVHVECEREHRCQTCGGDGEVHVCRDDNGLIDYINGRPTNEKDRCDLCGGEGYRI
jgi:hypothetical protein